MYWFGRDDGLPDDRLGYTPRAPDVVVSAPIATPVARQVQISVPAITPTPITPAEPSPVVPVATQPPQNTPPITPEPTPVPTASLPTLFVTGSRVNMRAGTSTREAVVAKLTRGTAVEFLGPAAAGWSEIRVLETGARGFMASQFLSPTQP